MTGTQSVIYSVFFVTDHPSIFSRSPNTVWSKPSCILLCLHCARGRMSRRSASRPDMQPRSDPYTSTESSSVCTPLVAIGTIGHIPEYILLRIRLSQSIVSMLFLAILPHSFLGLRSPKRAWEFSILPAKYRHYAYELTS